MGAGEVRRINGYGKSEKDVRACRPERNTGMMCAATVD